MCFAAQGNQHHDRFLEDEIVKAYFDNLRSRARSTGKDVDGNSTTHLSKKTYNNTKLALRGTIKRLGLTDSDHVITNLCSEVETNIQAKKALQRKLQALANEETPGRDGKPSVTGARNRITYFKGVLHRGGGIYLNVACDNHFQSEHKAIDPVTLRDIRNRLTKSQGIDVDLAAFTGERPDELYGHRISQFRRLNDDYYALDSIKFQNKGGVQSYGEVTVISSEYVAISERQVVALGVGLGDSE